MTAQRAGPVGGCGALVHVLIVRHVAAPEAVEAHVPGHIAYLDAHHADGTFFASGETVPEQTGGVILAHGVSREEVQRILAEDPLVRAGVSTYEVVTIRAQRTAPPMTELLASTDHGLVG